MDLAMAQRLVDRRKAAGLSQEALAAQLGVSRQAVSKWERSESSPDTDNLIALAALYGVSLDELLYGEAVASADDSQADDEAQNSNAGTKASDKAEEAEASTEHADCSDKPLVDISLARGIHVIDPNKGEEVHVGWSGIHVTNERKGEEVHVGPDGVHIDTLEDDGHSVRTNDDGTVTIAAVKATDADKARKMIEAIVKEPEPGEIYYGKVVRLMNFGAFVNLLPGKDGMVHISKMADHRIEKVEDAVKEGDMVWVKVMEIDDKGRVNLSMKDVKPEEKVK